MIPLIVLLPLYLNIDGFSYDAGAQVFTYRTGTSMFVCRGVHDFMYSAPTGVRITADRCDSDKIFANGFQTT